MILLYIVATSLDNYLFFLRFTEHVARCITLENLPLDWYHILIMIQTIKALNTLFTNVTFTNATLVAFVTYPHRYYTIMWSYNGPLLPHYSVVTLLLHLVPVITFVTSTDRTKISSVCGTPFNVWVVLGNGIQFSVCANFLFRKLNSVSTISPDKWINARVRQA